MTCLAIGLFDLSATAVEGSIEDSIRGVRQRLPRVDAPFRGVPAAASVHRSATSFETARGSTWSSQRDDLPSPSVDRPLGYTVRVQHPSLRERHLFRSGRRSALTFLGPLPLL